MNKSLREQLIEKGLANPKLKKQRNFKNRNKKGGTSNKEKRKNEFTERELAELMGTNRPTYGRGKGGAYRQR